MVPESMSPSWSRLTARIGLLFVVVLVLSAVASLGQEKHSERDRHPSEPVSEHTPPAHPSAHQSERHTPDHARQDHAKHGHSEHDHAEHGDAEHDGKVRHENAHHRFDDAERWSKSFDAPERDSWQKPSEVIDLMEIEPGMTVADIGAGTGYFVARLSPAVGTKGRVLGLDIEPAMVEFMAERAQRESWKNVEARAVAPDDPELEPGSVDRVLIVNTWHHIGDREGYSKKLFRGLAPGGAVFVVDFTQESSHGPPVSQRLLAEQVVSELGSGGLDAAVLDESLPDQYVVVGRRP